VISGVNSSQSFHIHEFWWVQDNPSAFRNYSAFLYIEFFLFGERKKETTTTKTKNVLSCRKNTLFN
jgi:hypothetical protein